MPLAPRRGRDTEFRLVSVVASAYGATHLFSDLVPGTGGKAGQIDAQVRRGQEQHSLPLDGAVQAVAELWTSLP